MQGELEKLKEKVKFYEYILNETSAIMFLNNTKNEMLWCNKRHEALFNLTKEDVNKIGLVGYVEQYLHKDDLNLYANSIEHLSDKSLDQSLCIYRQKDSNGNWRKILVTGKVTEWDENDRPLEGITCGIDITDKFAEYTKFEELLKENMLLKSQLKLNKLTKREMEILALISKGKSTKEIAVEEHISFHTVEWHRKNISKKLEIHKISELVRFAVECGI